MSKHEEYPEGIHQVSGEYVETSSLAWHYEGTNDYRNTYIDIHKIVDADGMELEPVWEEEQTELAPGVISWREERGRRLLIERGACPVRVLFREFFEYVSYTDYEHNSSWTRYFWVRYERAEE